MSNKINGLDGNRPSAVSAGRSPSASDRAGGGASADSAGSSESVHITDAASHLAALDQAMRDQPAVDPARVAAVRDALDQGTYSISAQRVAESLLSLERSLTALG